MGKRDRELLEQYPPLFPLSDVAPENTCCVWFQAVPADRGTIRSGVALLSGLIFCGRCGLRIASVYNSSGSRLRYAYNQMAINYGEALCQLLAGQLVDDWVSTQVLRVLEPATLEISLRSRLIWRANDNTCTSIGGNGWNGRNTRSNGRLVNTRRSSPSTLERQWEEALTAEAALQADYARFQAEQPPGPDR